MPETFDEGSIRFIFADPWSVVHYDQSAPYRKEIEKLNGTKAVDFVGFMDKEPYLLEIKDFRGHGIENKKRLGEPLATECAEKVRDTLAGLCGASRNATDRSWWRKIVHAVCKDSRRVPLRVVLWLEQDGPKMTASKRKAKASVQTKLLKQKLSWLTSRVLVVDQQSQPIPGLTTQNLPSAAGGGQS